MKKKIAYIVLIVSILFMVFSFYKYRTLTNYLNNPPYYLSDYLNDAVLILGNNPSKEELLNYLRIAEPEWYNYLNNDRLNVKEFNGTLVLYDFGYDDNDDNLEITYDTDIGFLGHFFKDGDVVIGEANLNLKMEHLDHIIAFSEDLKKVQFDKIQSLQMDSSRRLMMMSYYQERFRIELPYKFGYLPYRADTCLLIIRMKNDTYSAEWNDCTKADLLPDHSILIRNIAMLKNRNVKIIYWPILIAKDEKSFFFPE
jgi:hypothetical protein